MRGATGLLLLLALPGAVAPAAAGDSRPLLVTVDDLPLSGALHPEPADRLAITRALLAKLAERDIRAVGLVTWGNVRGPEDEGLLELWLAAGHELGNHSERHLDYNTTSIDDYRADVESARRNLVAFLEPRGRALRFFRFPMLHEGDTAEKHDAMFSYLRETGQRNLPVTLDNPDWRFERPWIEAQSAADRVIAGRVRDDYLAAMRGAISYHERLGDELLGRPAPQILLLHASEIGAVLWAPLLDWLAGRGYRFAGADEVLADPAFASDSGYVGPSGFGLWERLSWTRGRERAVEEVRALLDGQAEAWNRGDLDTYVAYYAEDAVFASTTGVHRGRAEVLARYRKRYPDRAAMGRLAFEIVDARPVAGGEVSVLGDARPGSVHGVTVVARWALERADGASSGLTLLVVHRTRDGWKIVQDASL